MANKENIALWVAALRSGEYEQAQGALRAGDRFCCLGVACEVAIKGGLDLVRLGDMYGKELRDDLLPDEMKEWLGEDVFNAGNVSLGDWLATGLNDDLYSTFPAIADEIEKRYLAEALV